MKKNSIFVIATLVLVLWVIYLSFSSKGADLAPAIPSVNPNTLSTTVVPLNNYCACLVGDSTTRGNIKSPGGDWPEPCETPGGEPGHLVITTKCVASSDCTPMTRTTTTSGVSTTITLNGVGGVESIKCVKN